MEPFFHLSVEEPLSYAAWQKLIERHPLYAYRRYRHHIHRANGSSEFISSLRAFQQITNRAPDRFMEMAYASLQQVAAYPQADRASKSRQLWQAITTQPYEQENYRYDVSLQHLCSDIILSIAVIEYKKQLGSTITESHPDWQQTAMVLAMLLEELELAEPVLPLIFDPIADLLAPYPDADAWRALWATNPDSARKQLFEIDLYRARTGIHSQFNAIESAALYWTIRS